MKAIISLYLLTFCSIVPAATYYVSPKGDNAKKGTKDQPWATFQYAVTRAYAGDTVYFRGGTYTVTSNLSVARSGKPNNPICFFNYRDEVPIFDCATKIPPYSGASGLSVSDYNYIHVKGLTVRNVRQIYDNYVVNGISCQDNKGIIIENCTVHSIGGHGFKIHNSDSIFYINCDAYDCADTLQIACPGNTAAGFSTTSTGAVREGPISYYGCRAWHCSDDGFDGNYVGPIYYDRCWSWKHGYLVAGAGGGFKWGLIYVDFPLHVTMKNCIAAYNKFGGFNENNDLCARTNMFVYNCLSYKNNVGFIAWDPTSYLDNENVYRNNISFDNTNGVWLKGGSVHSNNSWDLDVTVDSTDFVSLDTAQLRWPRQKDGSLPEITFGRLDSTSDLIDKGLKVGLGHNGDAPDLGIWEYELQPGYNNKYPSIEIISPLNGSTFASDSFIIISVNASDTDGFISKVEFYNEATKLDSITSSPWSFVWDNLPIGTIYLTAVATDDYGAKATSSRVYVNIKPGVILLYPNPNNGLFTFALTDPLQSNSDITIASLEGKVIYKDTMLKGELTKQINLSYIRSGFYILILSRNKIIATKKFIKK